MLLQLLDNFLIPWFDTLSKILDKKSRVFIFFFVLELYTPTCRLKYISTDEPLTVAYLKPS
jgi:hypothetical protein